LDFQIQSPLCILSNITVLAQSTRLAALDYKAELIDVIFLLPLEAYVGDTIVDNDY